MTGNSIVIRPFDANTDTDGAAQCFREGFDHILWPLLANSASSLARDIVNLVGLASPDSFAALVNNRVCGILFGAAPIKPQFLAKALSFGAFKMPARLALGRYELKSLAKRHLLQLAKGYSPFLTHHPRVWPLAEINLFTSLKSTRGKGLGRLLMDAFMKTVQGRGLSQAFVCTDTALSYHFYEAYGFSRVNAFPQKAYGLSLGQTPHTALIYRLASKSWAGPRGNGQG